MGWVPDNVIEALAGSHNLGIFVRVDTSPSLHLWFGVGDVPAGFDSIDPDGTVYLGGGQIVGIPSLEILMNGTSDAVDFTLSGVNPTTAAEMISSLPPVRGALVHVGITTLDQYYQPMSSIIPIWIGTASHTTESRPPTKDGEQAVLTLSLSVVSGENTRSRASKVLWSDSMQKSLYPTDDFCKGTALLARGTQPAWPHYA